MTEERCLCFQIVFAALVVYVRAGLLEQPSSATGWPQETPEQSWESKNTFDGQIPADQEREISIIKQRLGVKEGVSLTLSGPSHLVQTLHKVRTIDEGGKILLKTRDFAFDGEKDRAVIEDHFSRFHQRPVDATRFLSYDLAPQAQRYHLGAGTHEHTVLPSVQKEILTSRAFEVTPPPVVRKYTPTAQVYKFALIKRLPSAISVPQFFKSSSYSRVNSHGLVHQATGSTPQPHVHKQIVVTPGSKHTLMPGVYKAAVVPALHEHSAHVVHDGVIVPHMNNHHVFHQVHKHSLIPQVRKYVVSSRVHGTKWH